jgi:hypothetical protein
MAMVLRNGGFPDIAGLQGPVSSRVSFLVRAWHPSAGCGRIGFIGPRSGYADVMEAGLNAGSRVLSRTDRFAI